MRKKGILNFIDKPFKTHGGAKVPHRKNTAAAETVFMPPPSMVSIPMQQHIGASCNVCVKVGDYVQVGQLIGDSDNFVSAPIHASVSGMVKKIEKIHMPMGTCVESVVIESDGEMKPFDKLKPPIVKTPDDLVKASRDSGLVGLGGAGFPAHIKLSIPKGKQVDTLIVNLAECEPYITADHREAIENSWELLSGIKTIREILSIKNVIIAVENNKPDVIETLTRIADKDDPEDKVKILPLKSSYPQGAEKIIVKACTNREIPTGKLPIDVSCLVMNINSVTFLSKYLKTGMPLVSKRVTVDGSAIKNPQNVIVPLGTKISELIDFCGGYKKTPKKILMGGPMMGLAIADDSLPVLKQNNAILAFSEEDAKLREVSDCIRCGKCISSCPMKLMPTLLERYSLEKNAEELNKLGIMNCMECGCCAYNCPAKRPLVQAIRVGKAVVRNSKR